MKHPLKAIYITLLLGAQLSAQIPRTLSHQGMLQDASGNPIADGTYSISFAIYDTSASGTALWTETQSSVTAEDGIFNVILGEVTSIDLSFDEQYWLGISIETDPEMSPRLKMASVPYAINSFTSPPIGTIMAWHKSFANTPALPDGWAECNGQIISDPISIYNGQTIPDLNGTNNYIKGNSTSGGTGTESHNHSISDPNHQHGGGGTTGPTANASTSVTINNSNTISYYELVWIMRVK